jgi:ketosteroid isomerase-like protein
MAGPLQKATETFFEFTERKDAEALIASFNDDAQGIDEITRQWIRGKDKFADYLRRILNQIDGIKTRLDDVHESVHGDFGLMTCWIEQDYTLNGVATHVTAPTTVAFERRDGAWKISLFHSLPLPPEG